MPYDYLQQPRHLTIPDVVSGYELAPVTNKGLWSIVTPSGTVINLNTLGLRVLAYTGAGMPPIENITTALGVLGGSILQRTVSRPRPITLSCVAEGLTLREVQRIKNSIIAQVSPYNSLQISKVLKLHYQLVNYCGDLIGTALEVAVTYAGDLTGQVNNLYQDRFDLTFMEWAPPGIKELTTNQPSLLYSVVNTNTQGRRTRSPSGQWSFRALAIGTALHYDQTGLLWEGSGSVIRTISLSVVQVTNGAVYAITHDQNNDIYAGGAFTSPQNYFMKYSGGTWSHFGPLSTINGTVYAMLWDINNYLFIGGSFTNPYAGIAIYDPVNGVWLTLSSGTGTVRCFCQGLDGSVYIGGTFTSFNGTSSNAVVAYNPVTNVTKQIVPGTVSGNIITLNPGVYTLVTLPNGNIVAGGDFTTFNGIPCNNVAIYNGTTWQPMGSGLNWMVTKLVVNQSTGEIYATGFFFQSGNVTVTRGFAKWNGSSWVPGDLNNSTTVTTTIHGMDLRQSDGEISLTSDDQNIDLYNGGFNTVNYTGTADVYPQVKFTGPGILRAITNYTTGKSLYFNNYTMLAGETALFTHDPSGGITFVSSFYGNILSKILPGSDVTTFGLIPGANNIVPFVESATGATKVEFIYQNTHFSFDAGAGTPS